MKVLICIGHVPDTTSKIRFIDDDTKFNKTDIQYIVGPYEELGLTKRNPEVQLKERWVKKFGIQR